MPWPSGNAPGNTVRTFQIPCLEVMHLGLERKSGISGNKSTGHRSRYDPVLVQSSQFFPTRQVRADRSWQCSLLDLNRQLWMAVSPAGPQPPAPDSSVPRQSSTASQKICQIECQNECQKECQKICQKKHVRKNVKRCAKKHMSERRSEDMP